MKTETFDVLVIGGGATGTGVGETETMRGINQRSKPTNTPHIQPSTLPPAVSPALSLSAQTSDQARPPVPPSLSTEVFATLKMVSSSGLRGALEASTLLI